MCHHNFLYTFIVWPLQPPGEAETSVSVFVAVGRGGPSREEGVEGAHGEEDQPQEWRGSKNSGGKCREIIAV